MNGPANNPNARLIVQGGTVIDQTGSRRVDVAVENGRIVDVGRDLNASGSGPGEILDATGCIVTPGFVDLCAHSAEPGRERAETLEALSRAAVLGGFTAVVVQPDTDPVVDDASVFRHITELATRSLCDVAVAGAVTIDLAGEQLAPMAEMFGLGVRLFADGAGGVQDDRLMRRALEYAGGCGATIVQRPQNRSLAAGGHMHEGPVSSRLGIPGIPAEAEEIMVLRDVTLCRLTGSRVHFQHVSTAGSVGIIRAAKAAGLPITADVSPHHLVLTDEDVAGYDPAFKFDPPLRPQADLDALAVALQDGVIDAISTGHQAHEAQTQELPFDQAPAGSIGLQSAFALAHSHLVVDGRADLSRLLAALSWNPARVAGLASEHGCPVVAGSPANLTVIDQNETWVLGRDHLVGQSSNTPHLGRSLTGRVRHTIVAGQPVVVDGKAQR